MEVGVNRTDTTSFYKNRLTEELNFINYNILFSFGEILNFTIGRSFYDTAEIYKKHTLKDGREVDIKSNNINNYENHYLGLNTLSLSYTINFVEFIFSYNASWITFKDYECPANDCVREELSKEDFGGPVVEAFLFGLGIVFLIYYHEIYLNLQVLKKNKKFESFILFVFPNPLLNQRNQSSALLNSHRRFSL